MKKCNAVEMRKTLELVDEMKNAGIWFVPVPVLNKEDHISLIESVDDRLTKLQEQTNEDIK